MNLFQSILGRIRGYVDFVSPTSVRGWAADLENPESPVTIEVYCNGRVLASAVADRFRPDLVRAGIGTGRHGFECHVIAPPEAETVTVGVKGTRVTLPYKGSTTISWAAAPPLQFVAADLVNNCNLRCPFCLVDYSDVHQTQLMKEETFVKLLELLPIVDDPGFWLSCLHEPTLHPKLSHFLTLIPPEHRKKVWFTTNLARPLRDEVFAGWADSGIRHINVSMDSMDETLFAELRRFGRYRVFKDNLDRMTSAFRNHSNPPKIRYIHMAFKSNLDELPKMVEYTNQHGCASENEVRYTFNYAHINDEFRQKHYLEKADWDTLDRVLGALPDVNVRIERPPVENYEELVVPTTHYDRARSPNRTLPTLVAHELPLMLRARPDGTLLLVSHETEFSVNVNDLEDPAGFFRALYQQAKILNTEEATISL